MAELWRHAAARQAGVRPSVAALPQSCPHTIQICVICSGEEWAAVGLEQAGGQQQ